MKRLLEETGLEKPTEFERMLLGSIVLDVPPEGASARLMDRRLDTVTLTPIRRARRLKTTTYLLILAATAAVFAIYWRQHAAPAVPIAQEPPLAAAVSSENEPAMQMPLPPPPPTPTAPIVQSAPKPAPTVSVVRRPPPSSSAPAPALSALLRQAASSARSNGANGVGQPFDKSAAATVLRVSIAECANEAGPSGGGHVTVTFAPTGNVQNVTVDPPYTGTDRGNCVAAKYATVQVPPFDGSPVRVGKTFVLQ